LDCAAVECLHGFEHGDPGSWHHLYSVDENMEIDKVVPVAASVRTNLGRGVTAED